MYCTSELNVCCSQSLFTLDLIEEFLSKRTVPRTEKELVDIEVEQFEADLMEVERKEAEQGAEPKEAEQKEVKQKEAEPKKWRKNVNYVSEYVDNG